MGNTKFIDNSGGPNPNAKKFKPTVFTYWVDMRRFKLIKPMRFPSDFQHVEYLGTSEGNSMFRVRQTAFDAWTFYIGEKGDEFD